MTIPGEGGPVYSIQFSPDASLLLTASAGSRLGERVVDAGLWSTTTGVKLVELKGHEEPAVSARFSVDGKVIVTASLDGTARVWRAPLSPTDPSLVSKVCASLPHGSDIGTRRLPEVLLKYAGLQVGGLGPCQ
jgi:WD40 repeat protein